MIIQITFKIKRMKKIYFSILYLLLSILTRSFSQTVTISPVNQIPSYGDTVFYIEADPASFNPNGNSSTTANYWNYSTLSSIGTKTFYFEDPAPTGGGALFQSSNMARSESGATGDFYYITDSNCMHRIGWYESTSNFGIYYPGNSVPEFCFPITLGQITTTHYQGEFAPQNAGEDSVVISNGTMTVNADMQGTLILPTGMCDSALRIHVTETFFIDAYIAGNPFNLSQVTDDYYYWFVDTVFYYVLGYGTTTIPGQPTVTQLRYQPDVCLSSNSGITQKDFSIITTNSSEGIFKIICPVPGKNKIANIHVFDTTGKEIAFQIENSESETLLRFSENARGNYLLTFSINNKFRATKIALH